MVKDSQQLKRKIMQMDRSLEFFTEKELNMQIGQSKEKWAIALLKEAIDNALDSCENVNKKPNIHVNISDNSFSVSDNGAGLSKDTIQKSLDFTKRISDKSHYVSPTRGQLGNALKTIYAASFVQDGNYGKVEIESRKTRFIIEITLDRIAQKPIIKLTKEKSDRTEGVKITIFIKNSACLLGLIKNDDFYKKIPTVNTLLPAYAIFNPHATFTFGDKKYEGISSNFIKWKPNEPTSAHWYSYEQFRDLAAAYLSNGHDKTIREFVSEFRGISGTQKQKKITESTGLHGRLSDLIIDGDIDPKKLKRLHVSMQEVTQPVKPQQLGVIGKDHIISIMAKYYGIKAETIKYKKVLGIDNSLPYVIELAFGIKREEYEKEGRTVVCGLNWSPTLAIPLDEFRWTLSSMRIDEKDPVCVIMHIARPKFNFVDKGKGGFHA